MKSGVIHKRDPLVVTAKEWVNNREKDTENKLPYLHCECVYFLSSINHTCNRKLLTYAVLIQNKQTALNLLNNKQTIYSMSLTVQPNSRRNKNPQLSQFDPVTQIMLPNGVPVFPTFNVIN